MITHLLYKSFTQADLTPNQVEKILSASQANNSRDQISGLLLYRSKMFLQLLEGDERDVIRCLNRIRQDSRHYGPGIIFKVQSAQRIFPQWSMGCIPENQILQPLGNLDGLIKTMSAVEQPNRATIVTLLRTFVNHENLEPGENVA